MPLGQNFKTDHRAIKIAASLTVAKAPYKPFYVLNHAKFYNEKIFWCQKILQHCRLNLHWQRCRLNGSITLCYFSLKDDEKCLEYGEKCLGYFDDLYETDYIQKGKR